MITIKKYGRFTVNKPKMLSDRNFKCCCVYKMIIGNCFYIGSTVNLSGRIKLWMSHLKNGNCNRKVRDKVIGNNEIQFRVIEIVSDSSTLMERENYYLSMMGNSKFCLNVDLKTFSINPKKVLKLDLSGNVIQEYDSVGQTANLNKIQVDFLRDCLNGKNKTCFGYIFRFKGMEMEPIVLPKTGRPRKFPGPRQDSFQTIAKK